MIRDTAMIGLFASVAVLAGTEIGLAQASTRDFGDPLPGLTAEQLERFEAGKEGFEEAEAIEDGVGPVFNDSSCVACHDGPATGGSSAVISTRIGTITAGRFDDLRHLGGPTIQRQGIGEVRDEQGRPLFDFRGEAVPPEATIVTRRRSNPLFGFGLVDTVPDSTFLFIAQLQRRFSPATAGRPHIVRDFRTGKPAVGRFGHKAQIATVFDFTGDAYKDEMGITVAGFTMPGAVDGRGDPVVFPFAPSIDGRIISEENPPQGNTAALAFNPVASPNEPDDEDLIGFTDFITLLAPPPRGPITREVRVGEVVFRRIGCARCHLPALRTGPHEVRALDRVIFRPYSDFLLHDMGALGDGSADGNARGSEMRTAPLWGLRELPFFLHDGRASTVEEAILLHDGQGRAAARGFEQLDAHQKRGLLVFLHSL